MKYASEVGEEKIQLTKSMMFIEPFHYENFDDNGLKWDIAYLNGLGLGVILLPLELLSEFVDLVTKRMVENNLLMEICEMLNHDLDFSKLNATSCGNLAYIHLNVKENIISGRALQLLEEIEKVKKPEMVKLSSKIDKMIRKILMRDYRRTCKAIEKFDPKQR